MSPQARETKSKINYWDYIKIQSFYTLEETNNKIKRQPTEWEEILHMTYLIQGWYRKYIKNLQNSTFKKPQIIQLKMGRRHDYIFLQRIHTNGQQTHEKRIIITNQGNANQKRYHFTAIRIAQITTQETPGVGEDVERKEPSCTVGGNANWYSHCGKQYGASSKN